GTLIEYTHVGPFLPPWSLHSIEEAVELGLVIQQLASLAVRFRAGDGHQDAQRSGNCYGRCRPQAAHQAVELDMRMKYQRWLQLSGPRQAQRLPRQRGQLVLDLQG